MKINEQGKTIKTGDDVIITEFRGGVSATAVMQVPEDSETHILPEVELKRRIRFNPETGKFEGHNGIEWTALGFDQQLKDAVDYITAGLPNKADLVEGKIPLSQINDALVGSVNYQGIYNATTNTPALPVASANKGKYWVVNVAGTQQGENYKIGDWVISNGTVWGRVPKAVDVDGTPTAGSNNAVSSAGVADALALKANTAAVNAGLDLKANTIDVNIKLADKISIAELNSGLATKANLIDLDTKANIADVNIKLADKISTIQFEEGLAVKASLSDLATKANVTDLDAKADITDVNTKLAVKANITDLNSGLALKASLSDLASKANIADMDIKL
ncbi:hypothetical protein, partial [Flavobacterium sp.]|uniref:hypothetical protein n=1 Tax=Flavobacterium sp. TaxID=239 RepID=UPI0026290EE9